MPETLADESAMLAAVVAARGDDAPRLQYADWLDEHAQNNKIPCPDCSPYLNDPGHLFDNRPGYRPERDPASGRYEGGWTNCKRCNDAGGTPGWVYVSDGRSERAEFIRVQVELARWANPKTCPKCGLHYDMTVEMEGHARDGGLKPSAELWCAKDHHWFYGAIDALRKRERELWIERLSDGYVRGYHWFTSPCGISTTLDPFIDGGSRGPNTPLGVVRRGFVAEVSCTLADWMQHGPRLVRSHPLESVRLTDREPSASAFSGNGDSRCAWQSTDSDLPSLVPYGLLKIMAEIEDDDLDGQTWRTYDTPDLAHAALSAAALAWARATGPTPPPPSPTHAG